MADFAARLLEWFRVHGRRDLPWQGGDAYRVWVSEIMLQQTQVATVIPYYERFVARFPTLSALADASADDVLAHWSGLGYYARARNLHLGAQRVRDEFGGQFPRDIETVGGLPGIGRSTAGAILAQAFGERHAILDGNAKRMLARHEGIAGWPGKSAVAAALWDAAERHTPTRSVADYTQAIMDLGATLCTRSKPRCAACPVAADCVARAQGAQADYPGRKPPKLRPLRSTTMLLAVVGDAVYLERRPPSGIWGGLWSLPELDGAAAGDWCRERLGAPARALRFWPVLRHGFSHYELDITPVLVELERALPAVADTGDALWYRLQDAPPGGIAAPVRKLLDTLRNSNGADR